MELPSTRGGDFPLGGDVNIPDIHPSPCPLPHSLSSAVADHSGSQPTQLLESKKPKCKNPQKDESGQYRKKKREEEQDVKKKIKHKIM